MKTPLIQAQYSWVIISVSARHKYVLFSLLLIISHYDVIRKMQLGCCSTPLAFTEEVFHSHYGFSISNKTNKDQYVGRRRLHRLLSNKSSSPVAKLLLMPWQRYTFIPSGVQCSCRLTISAMMLALLIGWQFCLQRLHPAEPAKGNVGGAPRFPFSCFSPALISFYFYH